MSFNAVRSIATSALMAAQVRMQVASSNIANADVAGYTKKTATQVAVTTAGVGTGTTVSAVSSDVDRYLQKDLVTETSALASATQADSFANSLQSAMGSTTSSDGSGTSLADAITTAQEALVSLSGTIESETLAGIVVESLDTLTAQLRETSSAVQGLRADADQQIADGVTSANDALDQIASLNTQIVKAKALGQSTADLEDQRFNALTELATNLDVSFSVKDSGEMRVYTTSGTVLVDSVAHHLDYTPAALVTASTSFAAITVDGRDITSDIKSGDIGGLLEQRDTVLPQTQAALDELAVQIADAVNAVYNSATSVPPPSVLTGTTPVSGSDALDGSGTFRVALVDADGALVSATDLELGDYDTIDELVDALNAIDGIDASISNGTLKISSTSGEGIAIGNGDADPAVSDYFGLNDLLVGTDASSIGVRSDILSGTTNFAVAELDTEQSSTGAMVLNPTSSLAQSLEEVFSGQHDFAAAGVLGATTDTLATYAGSLVSQVAVTASTASSRLESRQTALDSVQTAISSLTGVNIDEETAQLSELEQQYSTAAQILETLNAMFDALLSAARS